MPTYLARGVSARLGAMSLDDTISPEIIANRKTDKFEKLLRNSNLLNEMPVPFPGDEGRHRLNWIGDAPFIQVQACWEGSGEKCLDITNAPTGPPTAQQVKALVLHVNLSDRTYLSGLSGKKTSLKIEVFFNGQLCDCRLITTHDARTRVKGPHQIFAGTRVDFYAERPWVILPPGMAPDGSFETSYNSASVPQRWQDICRALQSEARQRGANKEGGVPPTARFLETLASMQMPDQIHNIQKPGGKVFGTIDVVITAGEGRKIGTGRSFMQEPIRMPDRNYPLMRQSGGSTANLQMLHGIHNSSDMQCQSLEPAPGSSGLNVDVNSHQEHGLRSEKDTLVPSGPFAGYQTGTSSSLELAQLNSQSQLPDDARHAEQHSEHQYLVTPSSTCQSVFPSPHMPQIYPSFWSPFSDTSRGPSILDYSNGYSALGNAAPYTRPPDAFHLNGHDPEHPPSIPHVGGIGVELQQFGPNMLPMPYWSPQETPLGFDHTQASLRSKHLLEASGRPPTGVQGFTPIPYSAQMAPSLVGHDVPKWPLMPGPSSDGRLIGSMPPMGLYSVPIKPKRSTTSRKKPVSSQLKKGASVIFLRRLVILGQNKTIVVDRQWDPPKRLEMGLHTPVSVKGQLNLSKSMGNPLELIKQKDMSASICEPGSFAVRLPTSSRKEEAQPSFDPTPGACPSSAPIISTEAPQHPVHDGPLFKSSSRKKRKTGHDTAVDKPCSSLGSKPPQNPPLNQGCVIAYAENSDKNNEQGVVRQIRSEKAGRFEENYIIFTTRFFVGEG